LYRGFSHDIQGKVEHEGALDTKILRRKKGG